MFKSLKFSSITTAKVYGWVFNELLPQARLHANIWPRYSSDPFGFRLKEPRRRRLCSESRLMWKDDDVCFNNVCVN